CAGSPVADVGGGSRCIDECGAAGRAVRVALAQLRHGRADTVRAGIALRAFLVPREQRVTLGAGELGNDLEVSAVVVATLDHATRVGDARPGYAPGQCRRGHRPCRCSDEVSLGHRALPGSECGACVVVGRVAPPGGLRIPLSGYSLDRSASWERTLQIRWNTVTQAVAASR